MVGEKTNLGFFTKPGASSGWSVSGMKKALTSLWKSAKALSELAEMANLLALMSSPNSVGMGPATESPSNIRQSSPQDFSSMVGTLSLKDIKMSVLLVLVIL